MVENQAIEVATSFQGDFKQEDGLVGLAFDSINQSEFPSLQICPSSSIPITKLLLL